MFLNSNNMQNIKDIVYLSVEEYNKTISKKERKPTFEKMTENELKGILYNTLRRNFSSFGNIKSGFLKAWELECTFYPNMMVKTIHLKGNYTNYNWDSDENQIIKQVIKETVAGREQFYATADMNEIADIVSSIK